MLNASFVRRFNAEQQDRVIDTNGLPIRPVPMGKEGQRFDLVAELAFEIAAEENSVNRTGSPDLPAATKRVLTKIALLKGEPTISPPSAGEMAETNRLLTVYREFFRMFERPEFLFKPRIMGAGILDQMEGDFCTPEVLFEVKAVNRNLLSTDLRQVICYLIAGLGSHRYSWSQYCIFNPRLAIYYSGRIDDLLTYASGKTPQDCISTVLDALMEREQPLEIQF
ncbi:MAG: hypothetical protein QOH88_3640 [Verrucomicrobiota bacterium]|jgi:hypothetical protein